MTTLFGEAERKRIEEIVKAAEAKSAAEIVVAIVPHSADYARFTAPPAVILAIILALAGEALFPVVGARWWVLLVLPLFAGLFWLFSRRPIAVRLAPDEVEIAAVRGEALRIFADKTLYETRGRTGVLILISELERRVEILADRGISAHVSAETWAAHVARVVEAIEKGDPVAGLEAVITSVAAAAPPTSEDAGNELPNLV